MTRLAATVILLRPGGAALEVLLLRRSSRSAFVPDAFVFPGGTVDDADYAHGAPDGWDGERLVAEFRSAIATDLPADQAPVGFDDARALVRAAVREVAEEADIRVDPATLHVFSHWITPASEPRRYNTFFFVAPAPAGQHGRADRVETHDERWLAPAAALAAARQGELLLVYPTIKHLERLAAFDDVDRLLAYARSKPIYTIMPSSLPEDGFRMPAALEASW